MMIPGHGWISDAGDLTYYRDMIVIIRDRIQDMINKGMTLEQVKAAKPTLDYDPEYGRQPGVTAHFVEAVYRSLRKRKQNDSPHWSLLTVTAALLWVSTSALVLAQEGRGGRGGRGGGPPTAKAMAPIDLTGYWTAVVTEDWHLRMLTAPKGDFGIGAPGARCDSGPRRRGRPGRQSRRRRKHPLQGQGRTGCPAWDPAKDEAEGNQCKAYGAAGVMRQPPPAHHLAGR